ncbi:amidophosphoribosyltransferase [Candidatus Woesearchaeota archaeon]|nr:amidophosphoribosyltransferase [Candidatus Woesearchaeota archaeon]
MTGLFGIVTDNDCGEELMFGTDYNSSLGTAQAGLAIKRLDGIFDRRLHNISQDAFKSLFFDDSKKMRGNMGIGAISDRDTQPLLKVFGDETYAIATSGFANNLEELAEKICSLKGKSRDQVFFRNNSDGGLNMTEVVAELINQERTVKEGMESVYEKVDGSCSLLLLNNEGLYAARDYRGRTPLVLGKNGSSRAVTSETCAFPNRNFNIERFLKPGEIVLLNNDSVKTVREGDDSLMQICAFLWVYTGDPASSYEGISVQKVRQRCGAFLAEGDADLNMDIITGVPDSGIAHAHGYFNKRMEMVSEHLRSSFKNYFVDFIMENREALQSPDVSIEFLNALISKDADRLEGIMRELNAPDIAEPLTKFRIGYGRSFTRSTQEEREAIAGNKLIPVPHMIAEDWDDLTREYVRGMSIVEVDDSLVRGTQGNNSNQKLWDNGASKVHQRLACPPLTSPCRYLLSTRQKSELATIRAIRRIEERDIDDISEYLDHTSGKYAQMVESIREEMGVTSLKYQTLGNLVKAIGLPREKLCLDCWQ